MLDEIGNPDAPRGSRSWALWFVGQAKSRCKSLDDDVRGLQRLLDKLEKGEAAKALGVESFPVLCLKELNLDEAEVNAIRQAKRGLTLGTVIARAKTATPLLDVGRPEKGQQVNHSDRSFNYGENADYLTARIARDRPDVLERMKAGEFPSVRKAAIEAGIIKVPSPLDTLKKLWAKASKREKDTFITWVGEEGW